MVETILAPPHPDPLRGARQVRQAPVSMAVPEAGPRPGEPPPRLGGPPIQPHGSPLPELLHRGIKVQDARRIGREALVKQAPQPPAAITEPDHLGRTADVLAECCEPQAWLEH